MNTLINYFSEIEGKTRTIESERVLSTRGSRKKETNREPQQKERESDRQRE